jgi:hypothetical protein
MADTDLIVMWPTAAAGPLSQMTKADFRTSLVTDLNLTYLQQSLNLSDIGNPTTARTNLGLGTAATANIGTSGNTVPLLNTVNTWSAQQSFTTAIFTGGSISLNNATSNWINLGSPATAGIPTFTTRSVGTKLIVASTVSAATVDYAIGIESGFMWCSAANSSGGFKWYAGTTVIGVLSGTGTLQLPAYTSPGVLINSAAGAITSSIMQTWTPQYDFATHGNLVEGYTAQNGRWMRIGPFIYMEFILQFTPSYTTASGNFILKNLPATATGILISGGLGSHGSNLVYVGGTWLSIAAASTTTARILVQGTGSGSNTLTTSSFPSAAAQALEGWMIMLGT